MTTLVCVQVREDWPYRRTLGLCVLLLASDLQLAHPLVLCSGFSRIRTRACHSRMLQEPNYMWGCKKLYQDRVFQPRNCANFARVTWPINESYYTSAHF
ncbi:hypothetical protein T484DRAFT_3312233 [Baffinella frigidus]|nr:hypothetical protein T484DRAFT_3312233 [Cryptophyta sp. CCMP2293]